MKIAVFDSGIGGLSVLYEAHRALPQEQFIFFADEDNVPYGTQAPEAVQQHVAEAFDFLVQQDVKAIVVACNTATSVAVPAMRERYDLPIIGMEPAAKLALDEDGTHRVLVVATPITVHGKKMQLLIDKVDKDHLVDRLALPRLVEFAERQEFDSPAVRDYLAGELAPYDLAQYSALVLGCTHFNYFKPAFRHLLPGTMHFVDGNAGTVRELRRQLAARGQLEQLVPEVAYYYSGRRVTDAAELKRIEHYLLQLAQVYSL